MQVPLSDLTAQYLEARREIDAAWQEAVMRSAFIGGEPVKRFETELAASFGLKYAVGVSSGTAAIAITLRSLGLSPDDEVITTVHTAAPTAEAITLAGARTVLCDIEEATFQIDPAAVEAAITPRTRALVPVHLYGLSCRRRELMAIAEKHRLTLVEDCAQAQGTQYGGRPGGTFGVAGCCSFFPSKNLGGFGDGGAVVTNDAQIEKFVRMYSNHGRLSKFDHTIQGANERLDALQAALMSPKLRRLEQWDERRRQAARWYEERLSDIEEVRLPRPIPQCRPAWHLYVIRIANRDALAAFLNPWTAGEILALTGLILGAALVLWFRLGAMPPHVNAEVRCWKVVSAMTATGDWLVPRRDGEPALNKPPLFYWAASAISWLAGGASYATLRAPSVIAALGLLLMTYFWARSLGGAVLALVAVGLLAAIWRFYEWGRQGTFEMMLALLTNAALLTFDRIYWKGRRALTPVFFLLVVASFMTKGTPALMIIGVPIILLLAFRKEIGRLLTARIALWSAAALVLSLLWYVFVFTDVPEAWERIMGEALLPMGIETAAGHTARHYKGPHYFLVHIFEVTRFVCLLLPLVIWRGWQTRFWRSDPRMRFCAWIAAGLLAAFSLFPQKQPHYMLPLLPTIGILMAESVGWAICSSPNIRWVWVGAPLVAMGAGSALAAFPIAWYLYVVEGVGLVAVIALSVALVAAGVATVWLFARRKWAASGGLLLATTWLIFSIYFSSFAVLKARFRTGEIRKPAHYDQAKWDAFKRKHWFLADALKADRHLAKDKEEGE